MKNILSKLLIAASIVFASNIVAQCYNSTYGQWPSATFTPTCNNTFANITTSGYASEYSIVSLVAGNTYTFRSSVATDFITVDNNGAAPLVGTSGISGLAGISWTCSVTGTYRFYTHTNSSCGSSTALRTRSVSCSAPAAPSSNCTNSTSFGSATINTNGTAVTISSCNYAGEYSTISGAVNGQTLRFTSSQAGDYITVRSGSVTGTVIAQGSTPLQFSNTFTGTLYVHWNTATSCGTQSTCRTTTVQCMNCTPPVVNPCSSISSLTCGNASGYFLAAGNGAWNNLGGPYLTPGGEKVFQFTPTLSGIHNISVSASEGYVDLYYKTGTCGSTGWTYVDDIIGTASNSLTLTAGTTYYFLLDDENTTATTGNITITCPTPAPNPCLNISTITACTNSTSFSIPTGDGAWNGYGGPYGVPGQERIYSFTPTTTANYVITVVNNGPSSWVDLYWKPASGGCSSSGWTYVNDNYLGTETQTVQFTAGVTYYIMLDPEANTGATGSIAIACPDSDGDGISDNIDACPTVFGTLANGCPCIGSTVDGSYTYSAPFTISGTTVDACDNSSLRAGYDRIYAVNISCAGSYTFSLCNGASWDTYLTLSSSSGSGLLASNDDFCSLQSQITYNVTSPGTYYIAVEPYSSGTTGTFTISVSGTGSVPSITGSATAVSCNGGSNGSVNATVNGNGNSATATFNGSPFTGTVSGLSAGTYTVSATNCWGTSTQTFTVTEPTVLSASSISGNIACNGGTTAVSVTASGGTAPYTGTGANTVGAGSYSYTVTDANGCTASTSITVTEPTALVASSTSGNIACNGGTTAVSVTASGGTAPYTGTGANTVGAGSYSYTVTDANGCTASTSITVTEPTTLSASSTSGAILCNGGTTTVSVSANGGTAPYTGIGANTVGAGSYSYTVTDANGCTASTSITVTEPTALVASSTSGTILCNGGSTTVTVAANGGTAPYSGTGTFNVVAGDYTYTVTDANGCTSTTTISVTQPTPLKVTYVSGKIACFGGTADIQIDAMGGTPPYTGVGTYNVSAGTYSYTVTDANGCTSTVSVVMPQPALLVASVSATPILCNGGSSQVTVSSTGGTGTIVGTGTFNEVAGTYYYTITDENGCQSRASITITEPTVLEVSSSATSILCNGGTGIVTVSAEGGTAAYNGTGNYSVTAGTYTYTVTDANGCQATTVITLGEPAAVVVSAGSDATVYFGYAPNACTTLNATGGGGTGSLSYSWSNGTTGNSNNVCPSNSTTYTVTATDANGCQGTDDVNVCVVNVVCYAGGSNTQKVEVCHNGNSLCLSPNAVATHLAHGCTLGSCAEVNACNTSSQSVRITDEAASSIQLSLFPNPANNQITLVFEGIEESAVAKFAVFNSLGSQVLEGMLMHGETTVNISMLSPGVYFLKTDQTDIKPIRFIKE